ncbi:MAG: type II toxin-antitoxin system RelE/ParE family toxin [Desulfuromusa sp.]|nr:type II toxin-antitoxin system RelE/ParE family toxin [Desulfuromusa sp.]
MTWQINFEDSAFKELGKLDKQVQRNILQYMRDRIAMGEDPRSFGHPLRDNLVGLWKYRVGNYRIICTINDNEFTVLVLRVGLRRQIYGDH